MRRLIPGLALALVVSACGGAVTDSTTTAPTAAPTTTTSVATSTSQAPALAAALRQQVDWYLALLNGATFDETDYSTRFAAVFLGQVSAADFAAIVEQLRAAGMAWQMIGVVGADTAGAAVRIAPASGDPVVVLSISLDAAGRIDGLLLQPDTPLELEDPPETIEQAADRLGEVGTVGFVVADVVGGECTVRTGRDVDVAAPLGSMFKLYVLGAVIDGVAAGTIAWDQPVAIVDAHRSLPSGIVQNDPPGATRTVRQLAELMISISDNTATDHLLFLVGRDAVEQAQQIYGHSDPARNEPFLSTTELFVLKLADRAGATEGPGSVGTSYLAADTAGRRMILEDVVPQYAVSDLVLTDWLSPIEVDTLEWFATPLDLCRAHVLLHDDPEAARILAINPGLPDEVGRWDYVGYKGGSEPGVLAMSWYLAHADGSASVVAGTVWNPTATFDETEAVLLFGVIRDLSA